MGLLQRQLEEDEARGWGSGGDRQVCPAHVEDEALQELLTNESEDEPCSYCAAQTSAPIDVLIERIAEGFRTEYGNADDEGAPRDEGGYAWPTTDTWDLLTDSDAGLLDDKLFNDVYSALPDQAWIERDYVRLREDEQMVFSWEEFGNVVKHRRRFFFGDYEQDGDRDDPDFLSPGQLLERIGEAVRENGRFRQLPAGTELWRVREHEPAEHLTTIDDFGPPPTEHANLSGRMNPAGIPVLYAGCERDTALAEAEHAYPKARAATIGHLSLSAPIWIVDLADPPPVPSLFSHEETRVRRPALRFLHNFAAAIATPFKPDDRVHIEYVPAQVVTEWFRTQFETPAAEPVLGIAYRSARIDGGTNLALFVPEGNEDQSGVSRLAALAVEPERVTLTRPGDEGNVLTRAQP